MLLLFLIAGTAFAGISMKHINTANNDFVMYCKGDTIFYITNGYFEASPEGKAISILADGGYILRNNFSDKSLTEKKNRMYSSASGIDNCLVISERSERMTKNIIGTSRLIEVIGKSEKNLKGIWGYNDMMPALSADGRVLYFVSDRPGGEGGLDIWRCEIDEHGYRSEPEPVTQINTEGDEITPHCGIDGKFYFASNFKNGEISGNFDIYSAPYFLDGEDLKPFKPSPVKKINTDKNEIFPVTAHEGLKLYYSSDFESAVGKYDIYMTHLPRTLSRFRLIESRSAVSYLLRDKTADEIFEILPEIEYSLQKGHAYLVFPNEKVCRDCRSKPLRRMRLNIASDTLIELQLPMRRTEEYRKTFIMQSTNRTPLYMRGYSKPLSRSMMKEFRELQAAGEFDNSPYIDSSFAPYGKAAEQAEQIRANAVAEIADYLLQYSGYCPGEPDLHILLSVYTDDENPGGYRSPYSVRRNEEYFGDTLVFRPAGYDKPITLVPGIDIDDDDWTVDGEKQKLKGDEDNGNLLLTHLRAYEEKNLLDSLLAYYSPVYRRLKELDKIDFEFSGAGVPKGMSEPYQRSFAEIRISAQRIPFFEPEGDYYPPEDSEIIAPFPPVPTFGKPGPTLSADGKTISTTAVKGRQSTGLPEESARIASSAGNGNKAIGFVKPEIYIKRASAYSETTQDKVKKYSVLVIKEYENFEEAKDDLKLMRHYKAKDCRIIKYFDFFGNKIYRLQSPEFDSPEQLATFKRQFKTVLKKISPDLPPRTETVVK